MSSYDNASSSMSLLIVYDLCVFTFCLTLSPILNLCFVDPEENVKDVKVDDDAEDEEEEEDEDEDDEKEEEDDEETATTSLDNTSLIGGTTSSSISSSRSSCSTLKSFAFCGKLSLLVGWLYLRTARS